MKNVAVERSDIRCISLRPSWVQNEVNCQKSLGPSERDAAVLSPTASSDIDGYDPADTIVLATASDLLRRDDLHIASPDNVGGRNFDEVLQQFYGDKIGPRTAAGPDASGISSEKARQLFGGRRSGRGGTPWTPNDEHSRVKERSECQRHELAAVVNKANTFV